MIVFTCYLKYKNHSNLLQKRYFLGFCTFSKLNHLIKLSESLNWLSALKKYDLEEHFLYLSYANTINISKDIQHWKVCIENPGFLYIPFCLKFQLRKKWIGRHYLPLLARRWFLVMINKVMITWSLQNLDFRETYKCMISTGKSNVSFPPNYVEKTDLLNF